MRKIRKWHAPVPIAHFSVTQPYLQENWQLYPEFGHHTGTDYGGAGESGIPLYAVASGEIVYSALADSQWGKWLGNHAALYIKSIDRSFLYCHMAGAPHPLGKVRAGQKIGIMGTTGESTGPHLHLEGFHGKFDIAERAFTSLDDIQTKTFDPDVFLRNQLISAKSRIVAS